MNRKIKITILLSLLIMFFCVPMSKAETGLITSIPDLCNEPNGDWAFVDNEFNNNDYITFGEEGGDCVMTVPQAPTADGSAFCFHFASTPANIVELKADLMLSYNTNDHSDLLLELKRIFPDGSQFEIRGWILSGGGSANLFGSIHYSGPSGNHESIAQSIGIPANFGEFYSFKIMADGENVTISVGDIEMVSWTYDYEQFGQWSRESATIGGISSGGVLECKVKNVQALIEKEYINKIGFWNIQHRKYEDGRKLNLLNFAMYDESNNPISEDIVSDVEVTDPNGQPVSIVNVEFSPTRICFPYYDSNNGHWVYNFNESGDLFFGWKDYKATVNDDLIIGQYTLTVTDNQGNQYTSHYNYNGLVDLPIIEKKKFKNDYDNHGNLKLKWSVPWEIDDTFSTSIRAHINIYNDNEFAGVLFARVPTHLGRLFIPQEIIEKLLAEGNKFYLQVQLRTNDNNNRTYSKEKKIKIKLK